MTRAPLVRIFCGISVSVLAGAPEPASAPHSLPMYTYDHGIRAQRITHRPANGQAHPAFGGSPIGRLPPGLRRKAERRACVAWSPPCGAGRRYF